MEQITSRNNRWIKLATQLKQKKYREKNNMFLMEGIRNAKDAQIQKIKDVICLVQENKTDNEDILSIIEKGKSLHWLFCEVNTSLLNSISDTEHGQGIILLVKKDRQDKTCLLKEFQGKYIYLDTIQDPGNLGTIIRTAAAAGCAGVLLSEGCTDPYSEKAVRSSMGSILRIPVYEGLTDSFLREIREKHKIPLIGTTMINGIPYKEAAEIENGIFIFGNEGNGIHPALLHMTDWNLSIPLAGTVESLNVSAAIAIILFHYF